MDTRGRLLPPRFCFLSFVGLVGLESFILAGLAGDGDGDRDGGVEGQGLLLKLQVQNIKSCLYLTLQLLLQTLHLDVNGLVDEIL